MLSILTIIYVYVMLLNFMFKTSNLITFMQMSDVLWIRGSYIPEIHHFSQLTTSHTILSILSHHCLEDKCKMLTIDTVACRRVQRMSEYIGVSLIFSATS